MNTENKFTPGPWVIKQVAPLTCAWTFDFDEMGLGHSISHEEFEANANLITASPELLEMLEKTRGQWIHSVHAEECLAVIAKAKGELT